MTAPPDGPSDRLSVPAGYRIGPWTVGKPLGSGAFGTVYAAHRGAPVAGVPTRAALKVLPTGTRTPRQLGHLRELVAREVELLRRVRAPRLIRLYEVRTLDDPALPGLDGASVLVLELAERSLEELLDADRTPRGGPALLVDVCAGLDQLHRAGWVHGDLKPGNVLLMADGTARLADFNVAAELEGTHAYAPVFGTADYTAPDLVWSEVDERGRKVRPSADIWAFGVLAHLVLTGTHPLPGGTPGARRDAALRYARGQDELRLSPELPEQWRPLLTDCLARRHEDRAPHTAASLLRRVQAAAAGRRAPWNPGPFLRRHSGRLLTAATAALATALGVGLVPLLPETGYDRCDRGAVCFFTEPDGQGELCAWVDSDEDWYRGELTCGWSASSPPRSVFNNGQSLAEGATRIDVGYFADVEYQDRIGCLPNGERRNLPERGPAPYSHEWVRSCDD
ncbi:serine/threonine-protein kinase [Kitasatospora sp. NPDC096147]|uniref:serine/threonine-protein kinase n=1 Tax=Kitasatospora sp. NPDC096147 TaxID=3364093 RepID=UPI003820B34F